jgi:hypothetical protein
MAIRLQWWGFAVTPAEPALRRISWRSRVEPYWRRDTASDASPNASLSRRSREWSCARLGRAIAAEHDVLAEPERRRGRACEDADMSTTRVLSVLLRAKGQPAVTAPELEHTEAANALFEGSNPSPSAVAKRGAASARSETKRPGPLLKSASEPRGKGMPESGLAHDAAPVAAARNAAVSRGKAEPANRIARQGMRKQGRH